MSKSYTYDIHNIYVCYSFGRVRSCPHEYVQFSDFQDATEFNDKADDAHGPDIVKDVDGAGVVDEVVEADETQAADDAEVVD